MAKEWLRCVCPVCYRYYWCRHLATLSEALGEHATLGAALNGYLAEGGDTYRAAPIDPRICLNCAVWPLDLATYRLERFDGDP